EPGSTPQRCPTCDGAGEVRRSSRSVFGQFVNIATCGRCHGEGSIVTDPCGECRGQGRERKSRRLEVDIPAGVNDGSRMRLSGEGDTGLNGGPPGHLYVYINVAPHEFFSRQEEDLIFDLEMNPAQAALGFEAAIPTLDGDPAVLKVPAGTQSGRVFALKRKGIPRIHGGGRGDLLVRTELKVPTDLSDEQRDLLHQLAESFGTPVGADKGLLNKIKDALG
ncbi:MAG: molecular chaperone DnaJ, partial [Chloroflexi bacterium]